MAAVVALLAVAPPMIRADVAPPFFGNKPPPLPAAPSPTASARLEVAQKNLTAAAAALARGHANLYGGYVEKAGVAVHQALADVAAATAYLKEHPGENTLPAGPAPEDKTKIVPTLFPEMERIPGINLMEANLALNLALVEFLNNPGRSYHGPVIGDLGGFRAKIMTDINQASAALVAGALVAEKNAEQPPPPPPAGAMPSAGPRTSSRAPGEWPSVLASVSLSVGLALGGLHFFASKRRIDPR